MDFLTDWLTDWLKELLIGGIMGNLEGLFDYVNTQVGEIAVQVGTTPAAWNAGVFSLIRQLSETVILPIAGLVLPFVATSFRCFWKKTICTSLTWRISTNGYSKRLVPSSFSQTHLTL